LEVLVSFHDWVATLKQKCLMYKVDNFGSTEARVVPLDSSWLWSSILACVADVGHLMTGSVVSHDLGTPYDVSH
jgi:hypothetical protein